MLRPDLTELHKLAAAHQGAAMRAARERRAFTAGPVQGRLWGWRIAPIARGRKASGWRASRCGEGSWICGAPTRGNWGSIRRMCARPAGRNGENPEIADRAGLRLDIVIVSVPIRFAGVGSRSPWFWAKSRHAEETEMVAG